MSIFKEIGQFIRFFWMTPSEAKRIVFYSEHEGYYPNFEGLLKELVENYHQPVCYVTSDRRDPILGSTNPSIKSFYIRKLLALFIGFIKCRVFIMTMTDLNQFHIKRSINPVHFVYIFHSLVSTHMLYLAGAFDYYDSVLCTGRYQVKEIRRYEELHNLPAKKLVEAGYYRLERIYNNYRKYIDENQEAATADKVTVLIAPSWGGKNIIESCGRRLVKILLENDCAVIVRPHPETIRRTPGIIADLIEGFGDNPDFYLEKSVATDDSLFRADVLISDLSGIVLEYAFGTERPVLFIDVPPKIRNENYKELGMEPLELAIRSEIGMILLPDKLDRVPEVMKNLRERTSDYRERIRRSREKYISVFGQSSKAGAEYIMKLLKD